MLSMSLFDLAKGRKGPSLVKCMECGAFYELTQDYPGVVKIEAHDSPKPRMEYASVSLNEAAGHMQRRHAKATGHRTFRVE